MTLVVVTFRVLWSKSKGLGKPLDMFYNVLNIIGCYDYQLLWPILVPCTSSLMICLHSTVYTFLHIIQWGMRIENK